jgi:phosphoglycolate phosphatase
MYKACIFDLDGTLTDTLDSLTYSVNETLKEMGLSVITREECRIFVGNGSRALMEKALRAGGDTELKRLDEAMERYGRIFDENCTYHVIPYEGISQLLNNLKAQGIRLAVLSNKPDRQAVHVVEEIFGTDVFQRVQGQKEGIPRKPDPSGALQIAEMLGAVPEETLYIGDSEVDIETGMAAKMRTIGVSWGFRGRTGLESAGAEVIVDSPDEILNFTGETLEVENHE